MRATTRLSQNMRDRDVRSWCAQAWMELAASVLAFLGGSTGLWCLKFGMVAGISWYVHWIGAVWCSCLPDGLQRFKTSFLTHWFGPEGAAAHGSSGCQKQFYKMDWLTHSYLDVSICIQMYPHVWIRTDMQLLLHLVPNKYLHADTGAMYLQKATNPNCK